MFERREVAGELAAVRAANAPGAIVLECAEEFGTLEPAVAESLLAIVDDVDPLEYDPAWVPDDAPAALHRLAGDEFTVGTPGAGGVAWTSQTDPATVFVKPRLAGSPDAFVEFLIAEGLVEAGLGLPETVLGFFRDDYQVLDTAVPLSPVDTYQIGVALFDAYVGLHTSEVFADWAGTHAALYDQWVDAGTRLEPRLAALPDAVGSGRADLADAVELACSGVKHDLELPDPFAPLETEAYRKHGAAFAVRWAERTVAGLGK